MRAEPSEKCLLCGSVGRLIHETLMDQLFGASGEWSVRQCSDPDCGLSWLDPMPLPDDLHLAYSHYYTHGDGEPGQRAETFDGSGRRLVRRLERCWLALLGLRNARRDIEVLFLNGRSGGRVLEVGCGDGARLEILRRHGWAVEGQEVDPTSAAHAVARGFSVHLGSLDELDLPEGSFDAVVMNHVLEHLADPVAVLEECRRLLRPGGQFVATTPNTRSYGHAKFGRFWIGLDVPRHLHLFPPTAAARLAERAGFSHRTASTSPARAGGLLAASREIEHGSHQMRGPMSLSLVISALWYQLTARIAHLGRRDSGEETVLRAFR